MNIRAKDYRNEVTSVQHHHEILRTPHRPTHVLNNFGKRCNSLKPSQFLIVATAQEKQTFLMFIFPHRVYTVNLAETLEKLEGFTSNTGYTDVTF